MSTSFMSAQQICDAVREGKIRIAYYALRTRDGQMTTLSRRRYVYGENATEEDQDINGMVEEYFADSLEPDSLTFHVGPFARLEKVDDDQTNVIKRDNDFIVEVTKADNLLIPGGGFILIGTNEYIELSEEYGALLFAKVRNTNFGLSHVSTLIDPSWKGVLQIGIGNLTTYTKRLRFLDPICRVRFYKLFQRPPEEIIEKVSSNRTHYGKDWWGLEKEGYQRMFPMDDELIYQEGLVKQLFREKLKLSKEKLSKWILKYLAPTFFLGSITLLLVSAQYVGEFNFVKNFLNNRMSLVDEVVVSVRQLEKQNTDLRASVLGFKTDLENLKRKAKTFTVTNKGEFDLVFLPKKTEVMVELGVRTTTAPTVLLDVLGIPADLIDYKIKLERGGEVTLTIRYLGVFQDQPTVRGRARWFAFSGGE